MEAAVSDRVSLRGIGFRCLKFVTLMHRDLLGDVIDLYTFSRSYRHIVFMKC